MIHLIGRLICTSVQDVGVVTTHLTEHIRLSRAEPGCLQFDVVQTADPLIWQVDETFVDQDAFDLHQTRTRSSLWFAATRHIPREFAISELPLPAPATEVSNPDKNTGTAETVGPEAS